MALVALALVLSLMATLAPDASAQDSGAAPDGAAKWMRYNMPAAQDWETAAYAIPVTQPKNCCITVEFSYHNGLVVNVSAAQNHCIERPRWFCMGTAQLGTAQ